MAWGSFLSPSTGRWTSSTHPNAYMDEWLTSYNPGTAWSPPLLSHCGIPGKCPQISILTSVAAPSDCCPWSITLGCGSTHRRWCTLGRFGSFIHQPGFMRLRWPQWTHIHLDFMTGWWLAWLVSQCGIMRWPGSLGTVCWDRINACLVCLRIFAISIQSFVTGRLPE